MRPHEREKARKALDKRLNPLRGSQPFARPPRGWIKAIREALGMTTAQLAKRIGVSQPRVVAIEKAEIDKAITLESLERAAHALDCQLVYTLIPRQPLEQSVKDRAMTSARQRLKFTAHSMALEDQAVDDAAKEEQIRALAAKLLAAPGSKLWDEN